MSSERFTIYLLGFGCFIILLVLAFGCFVAFLQYRQKMHGQTRGPDPGCGSCGYSVRGLSTMICPECGADPREVGIIPPELQAKNRKPARPPLFSFTYSKSFGKSPEKNPKPAEPAPSASRTATVLLTDMKDYTARAHESSREDGLALLRRHRDIVQPIVQQRAGRIIKSTGDGLIAVFDSATESLLAGLEIQRAVAANNQQSFTEQTRFLLRIAVSTGEVTLADDDVLGQPVNLASRVQQFAQPGEVCFTESTFHAMNRKEIAAQVMEPVEVKGIAGKVNLYRCEQ